MNTSSLVNINGNSTPTLEIILIMTVIALLPSLIIMMTSFTRTIIILSFVRNAIGVQNTPPNMVLVGIALFLTLFIMKPVVSDINTNAYQPYAAGKITQEKAIEEAKVPLKEFMLKNTETSAENLFIKLSGEAKPAKITNLPMTVVIPAFMTSELKRAFMAGFLLYLPFLIIDIVVSSTLMAMGMMMLPPAMISLPFKLLLFVTVNGWELLFSSIVSSFR